MVAHSAKYPHHRQVPKDVVENLRFRQAMCAGAAEDVEIQDQLWVACQGDLLFWIDAFVWTFDPRPDDSGKELELRDLLPFVMYPFQEEGFARMHAALGKRDLLVEKSRDQGASWMFLILFTWVWLFKSGAKFTLVSRTEDLVDKTGDSDSLMWKIDHILAHLPRWMAPPVIPKKHRTNLHLRNPLNGSVIDGVATTGNVARGGRRTAILLDEFAAFERQDGYKALFATQHATPCRFFNSTPQGAGGAHYDIAHPPSEIEKLRFHWSDHPVQNRGLYTSVDGKLNLLDTSYEFPEDYKFVLDDKLRSPYYDNECKRAGGIATIIAQEMDIDYLGAGSQFFDANTVRRLLTDPDVVMPPFHTGELDYSDDPIRPLGLRPRLNGHLKLWIHPDAAGEFPRDRNYCVGADISAGKGVSNSTLAVGDKKTGEIVARYACPDIRPEPFAEYAVAVAKWFKGENGRGALLIWEQNGPGEQFGPRVHELGYSNIFYREQDSRTTGKKSSIPGWFSNPKSKRVLLAAYELALATGQVIERDKEALREMLEYIYGPSGSIVHAKSLSAMDSSGAKDNHGDRVIAGALVVKGMHETPESKSTKQVIPPRCYQALRNEWEEQRNRELVEVW